VKLSTTQRWTLFPSKLESRRRGEKVRELSVLKINILLAAKSPGKAFLLLTYYDMKKSIFF
jgi:hypothetical protein